MDVVLARVCYGTAIVAAATNIPATASAWRAGGLGGQGPRFPDPIIAALLGNAAWFTYGWISGSKEAMWVNLPCGSLQLVYLMTFLALCTNNERRTALKRITWALLYLAVVVVCRLAPAHGDTEELRKRDELHKLLCTLAGAAAPVTPLLIAFYNQDEMNVVLQMVPHWLMSCIALVNGLLWSIRGFTLFNMYMVIMNAVAAVCSCISLVLILCVLNQQLEAHDEPLLLPEDIPGPVANTSSTSSDDEGSNQELTDSDSEEENGQSVHALDENTHQELQDGFAGLRVTDDSEPEEEFESEPEEEFESEPEEEFESESEEEIDPSAQALDVTVHQEASSSTSPPATPGESAESSGTVADSVPAAPGADTE